MKLRSQKQKHKGDVTRPWARGLAHLFRYILMCLYLGGKTRGLAEEGSGSRGDEHFTSK